jgi:hypothetical protein
MAVAWYALLAMISAATFHAMRPAVVQVDAAADGHPASVTNAG